MLDSPDSSLLFHGGVSSPPLCIFKDAISKKKGWHRPRQFGPCEIKRLPVGALLGANGIFPALPHVFLLGAFQFGQTAVSVRKGPGGCCQEVQNKCSPLFSGRKSPLLFDMLLSWRFKDSPPRPSFCWLP